MGTRRPVAASRDGMGSRETKVCCSPQVGAGAGRDTPAHTGKLSQELAHHPTWEQAIDRVRGLLKGLLERGPRRAERALTSRERKGRACLCCTGNSPKGRMDRALMSTTGRPVPEPAFLLAAEMAPLGGSFDPQLGGGSWLNCRSTYKRQTPPRQKIPPHSVLLCIETNCVPCHECSKRPLRSLPSTQWRRATPSYPRMAVA